MRSTTPSCSSSARWDLPAWRPVCLETCPPEDLSACLEDIYLPKGQQLQWHTTFQRLGHSSRRCCSRTLPYGSSTIIRQAEITYSEVSSCIISLLSQNGRKSRSVSLKPTVSSIYYRGSWQETYFGFYFITVAQSVAKMYCCNVEH